MGTRTVGSSILKNTKYEIYYKATKMEDEDSDIVGLVS